MCHGFPESCIRGVTNRRLSACRVSGSCNVDAWIRKNVCTSGIEAYDINHLVGDTVAVANHLNRGPVVVAGHDWGAPVAWLAALMRPDLFRAVACLSVPTQGRLGLCLKA